MIHTGLLLIGRTAVLDGGVLVEIAPRSGSWWLIIESSASAVWGVGESNELARAGNISWKFAAVIASFTNGSGCTSVKL